MGGVDADVLMLNMENSMLSNGSTCISSIIEPSHSLAAMGLGEEEAFYCLRFGKTIPQRDIVFQLAER